MINPRDFPVRFSNLKSIGQSPAHYLARLEQQREQTPAMLFGSLVHALVLGGSFAVYDGERRGNAWKDFKAANANAEMIVTAAEHARAMKVASAVQSHPVAAPLLVGEREKQIDWEWLGRRCSSRLDVLGDGFITDLKTTNCAEPFKFQRAAIGMSYHAQLAFYRMAALYLGKECPALHLVAVETFAPYAVTVLKLTARANMEGEKLCRAWMERLLVCEDEDEWPSYVQSVIDMDVEENVELMIDGEVLAA